MSKQQWKERAAQLFECYSKEQQQLQYEQRLQRLAIKLEAKPPPMRSECLPNKENHYNQLEQRVNDLNERLNELSYGLNKEVQVLREQADVMNHYLEEAGLCRRGHSLPNQQGSPQQLQRQCMQLLENEMNDRRQKESTLLARIESAISDSLLEVLRQNEARVRSFDAVQSNKSLSQLMVLRELIETQTRDRTISQEQLICQLSQECRLTEERLSECAAGETICEEESFDMLKEVASKVAQELQLETLNRKRTEQQILLLIEALCDRLQPGL